MKPITTTYKSLVASAIIGVFGFAPLSAVAQEGGFIFESETNSAERPDESSTILSGESGDPISEKEKKEPQKKVKSTEKETQKTQKAVKSKSDKTKPKLQSGKGQIPSRETQSEDEESVLSFNFLHYLIQKYKFSDVIDE